MVRYQTGSKSQTVSQLEPSSIAETKPREEEEGTRGYEELSVEGFEEEEVGEVNPLPDWGSDVKQTQRILSNNQNLLKFQVNIGGYSWPKKQLLQLNFQLEKLGAMHPWNLFL